MCAGAAVMANVRHICFASRDPWAGATDLYTLGQYYRRKKIIVEGPTDPLFEAVLVAMQTEAFLHEGIRRGSPETLARQGPFFSSLEAAIPAGVALGDRLFQSGDLQRMRAERISAEEVIEALASAVTGVELLPKTGIDKNLLNRELFDSPVRQ
jgi:hypothetical protein